MSGNNLIAGALLLNALGLWACAGAMLYGTRHATICVVGTAQSYPFTVQLENPKDLPFQIMPPIREGFEISTRPSEPFQITTGRLESLQINSGTAGLDVNVKGP